MKRIFLIIPALALLAACGGGSQNQNGSGNGADAAGATDAGRDGVHTVSTTEPVNNFPEPATNVAYEVALKLNPQAKQHPPADTADKRVYSFTTGHEEFDLDVIITTRCFNLADGGFLAFYQEKEEGFIGDGFVDDVRKFDVYTYKDGTLTPKKIALPEPLFVDFKEKNELLTYGKEAKFTKYFEDEYNGYGYEIDDDLLKVTTFEEAFPPVYYDWDGTKFVKSDHLGGFRMYNVAAPGRLGEIYVGAAAPTALEGYKTTKSGNTLTFTRDGEKYFSILLDSNGKADTITVFSERLTYAMCAVGGCNYFGIGFSPVDDGFGMQYSGVDEYFIFRNGIWVRIVKDEDRVIEFHTTKDAIKDVKGTEGKIVRPVGEASYANEVANREAKVSLIKIYKTAGFCETCAKNSDNDNVLQIRKMYNAVANDKNLVKKHIEIEDEESGYPCDYDYYYKDGNLVMIQMTTGDGTMVDTKIYMQDGYPYFCFNVNTYPDNKKDEDRIYMCAGKIFKYLDTQKKDLNVNDDVVTRAQISINSIVQVALENEKKAK